MADTPPAVIIERLCGHLHTELFDAGGEFEFLGLDLDNYRRRFADGDETVVFVLLTEASQVVGFAAMIDLVVPRTSTRYLSIPAAAIAEKWRGGNPGFRLIAKVLNVGYIRNEAHHRDTAKLRYDGLACVPWTSELEAVLKRLQFTPLEGTMWWIRPYKRKRGR